MLIEFSCSNHKSIKDKITFSALASKDTSHSDCLLSFEKFKFDRAMAIYGANGSGKSNFLSAIAFAKYLVCNSIQYQPGQLIEHNPHKLSSDNTPSVYQFHFVNDGIRFAYGFSLQNSLVSEEYLFYFPNGRVQKIFERKFDDIEPGSKYKKTSFEVPKSILKENRLFLSCLANYSNLKEVESAFKFFSEQLVIYNPQINNWVEYSINFMKNNQNIKNQFLKWMQDLGTGIKDIKLNIGKTKIDIENIPQGMPNDLKNFLMTQNITRIDTKVVYEKFETDLMTEESSGIRKLFEIVCPIIDILQKGKILICDEIEYGLHESIVQYIVKSFNKVNKDSAAQLIFTTHDTSLLDLSIFRRDQIWFTQLNEDRATDLYSLLEIKNVRKSENISKGYVDGKYGAVPMLNSSFAKNLESEI